MDAIKILDNAISQVYSMRNVSLYQGKDAIQAGEEIKLIARHALIQIGAHKSVIDNINRISFGDEFACRQIVSDGGIGAMIAGLNSAYGNGLQAVLNILQQERDLRIKTTDNNIQKWGLIFSAIAAISGILTLIITLMK